MGSHRPMRPRSFTQYESGGTSYESGVNDLPAVFSFIGGLAFFLYGMSGLGKGLTKLSGGRLESVLARMCRTPVRGVVLGALVTAAVQSSSATTVMVVGFVNAGMMSLSHAVGVIMGANLGTTLTAWLLSLSGISGENPILFLLTPAALSPLLAAIGTGLLLFGKRDRPRDLGAVLTCFGFLFAGLEMMSAAAAPLAENPEFAAVLTVFRNPLAGLLAGALLTAILQSSSASVGILQVFAGSGALTVEMAVPIVMGQNIGTCVTALLSGVGAGKNAKRAALIHFYFNLFGAAILLGVFYLLRAVKLIPAGLAVSEASVALIHTVFNLAATAVLLPFSGQLLRLATLTVRDGEKRGKSREGEKEGKEQLSLLDERFLGSPSFALGLSRAAFLRMSELTGDNFLSACLQLGNYDAARAARIGTHAALAAEYEKSLSGYLVRLAGARLHPKEAAEVTLLISALPDAARIGERALHTTALAGEGVLSSAARAELETARAAFGDLSGRVRRLLGNGAYDDARTVEALAGVLEGLCDRMRRNQVIRLRQGICTPEAGNAFSSFICDMESVIAHERRLAAAGVRRKGSAFDPLRPTKALRELDGAFDAAYHRFAAKYKI